MYADRTSRPRKSDIKILYQQYNFSQFGPPNGLELILKAEENLHKYNEENNKFVVKWKWSTRFQKM